MATRTMKLALLYTAAAPAIWLRSVAASVDEGLAILCRSHWLCARVVRIEHPMAARRRASLR
jgi:hypothetical protein